MSAKDAVEEIFELWILIMQTYWSLDRVFKSSFKYKCALAFYGVQEMQHVIVSFMYKDFHFIAVLLAAE